MLIAYERPLFDSFFIQNVLYVKLVLRVGDLMVIVSKRSRVEIKVRQLSDRCTVGNFQSRTSPLGRMRVHGTTICRSSPCHQLTPPEKVDGRPVAVVFAAFAAG